MGSGTISPTLTEHQHTHAHVFLATKPSNTFYMAFKKVLEGFVKNGAPEPFFA